jgi:5-methylthioadenosine/S-adenosylhomocysteine deaminase
MPKGKAAATPVDPSAPGKIALTGRVVTMGTESDVRVDNTVWIADSRIVAITKPGELPPPQFETVKPVKTNGTIFPGLIDLHNHLPYNVLPLWQVPKTYTNRDQWGSGSNPEYRPLISGPMTVLGRPEYLPAVVRYVEAKALVGGCTTTEGIRLFSDKHGGQRYYRGIVRNVEQTDEPGLEEGDTRIADVDAKSLPAFDKAIQKKKKKLLHLSEGVDKTARNHFLALKLPPPGINGREWAITPSLIGIHCAGLDDDDFKVMHDHGASMIWSPMSNLLLYGATARIAAAKDKVTIGLGPDWSPSGSKNILGEMKAAYAYACLDQNGPLFTPFEIVRMVTVNAAAILNWGTQLGRLDNGFLADLIVVRGDKGDPFEQLVHLEETDLLLVMINGIARYGLPSLVSPATNAPTEESLTVGGKKRSINLFDPLADPAIGEISLARAKTLLSDTMHDLPQLETARAPHRAGMAAVAAAQGPTWHLALDEIVDTGEAMRPELEFQGRRTAPHIEVGAAAAARPLISLKLDPLTVADDHTFLERISTQRNLPAGFAESLAALYKI